MKINHLRHCYVILVSFIAFAVLLLSNNMLAAQEDDQPKASESVEPPSEVIEVQKNPDDVSEGPEGYHPEGRRVGTPTDVYRELIEVRQAMVEKLSAKEWDKVFG